jgi:hypothetical protein
MRITGPKDLVMTERVTAPNSASLKQLAAAATGASSAAKARPNAAIDLNKFAFFAIPDAKTFSCCF